MKTSYLGSVIHNPCLHALISQLHTTSGWVPPVDMVVGPPTVIANQRTVNTRVELEVPTTGSVMINYTRRSLTELSGLADVTVPVTYDPHLSTVNMLALAIAEHFQVAFHPIDIDGDSWNTLVRAPNGLWSMRIRASDNSYGWVDATTLTFKVGADLHDLVAVTELGDLVYP